MGSTKPIPAVVEGAVARLNALLPAANAGDTSAIAELRVVLDDMPAL